MLTAQLTWNTLSEMTIWGAFGPGLTLHTQCIQTCAATPVESSRLGVVVSFVNPAGKNLTPSKSSTEAEFVGASDYLPNTIWVKMFMKAQGYKFSKKILEQDNESAIKLEKNGRTSAGTKS